MMRRCWWKSWVNIGAHGQLPDHYQDNIISSLTPLSDLRSIAPSLRYRPSYILLRQAAMQVRGDHTRVEFNAPYYDVTGNHTNQYHYHSNAASDVDLGREYYSVSTMRSTPDECIRSYREDPETTTAGRHGRIPSHRVSRRHTCRYPRLHHELGDAINWGSECTLLAWSRRLWKEHGSHHNC